MKHIVKRRGHTEAYDQRKLYASVYRACLSVRITTKEAELIADKVCQDIDNWLKPKHEVTALDIQTQTYKSLLEYSPDAAYMYKAHQDILRR